MQYFRDFRVTRNSFFATFFEGHDFTEGEDRLCWTLPGLNKMIGLGLWKRELDQRGNLKTKPPTVAEMIRFAAEQSSRKSGRRSPSEIFRAAA